MAKLDGISVRMRKAFASKGDDTTFSRWVKETVPVEVKPIKPRQMWLPDMRHKVLELGRSIFWRKGVKAIADLPHVLVSGHNNVKVGRDVRKGQFRGYWIYYLTLEERATCPRTCLHWQDCYGNNMPYAHRVEHGPELLPAIERDLVRLLGTRGRVGILVRLHQLGDFYSRDYVWFWRDMLWKFPNLAVYGYTARKPNSDIGFAIGVVKRLFGSRFAVRWSDGGDDTDGTVSILTPADVPANAFVCPEQTAKTKGCGTCALCWGTDKNVAFVAH